MNNEEASKRAAEILQSQGGGQIRYDKTWVVGSEQAGYTVVGRRNDDHTKIERVA